MRDEDYECLWCVGGGEVYGSGMRFHLFHSFSFPTHYFVEKYQHRWYDVGKKFLGSLDSGRDKPCRTGLDAGKDRWKDEGKRGGYKGKNR